MKEFEKEVGQRIWELRYKMGYSREQLSELADISSKFLYEIETGKKGMSAYTLYRLSKVFDVSADYLLTGNTSNLDFDSIKNMLSDFEDTDIKHIKQIIKHITKITKKEE